MYWPELCYQFSSPIMKNMTIIHGSIASALRRMQGRSVTKADDIEDEAFRKQFNKNWSVSPGCFPGLRLSKFCTSLASLNPGFDLGCCSRCIKTYNMRNDIRLNPLYHTIAGRKTRKESRNSSKLSRNYKKKDPAHRCQDRERCKSTFPSGKFAAPRPRAASSSAKP